MSRRRTDRWVDSILAHFVDAEPAPTEGAIMLTADELKSRLLAALCPQGDHEGQ